MQWGFDGLSPRLKKWWQDRSAVGTDSDPVRGAGAIWRMQECGSRGVEWMKALWEFDHMAQQMAL